MERGKSHVQNLDTNLVREPVTTTTRDAGATRDAPADPEATCLGVCGEGLGSAARAAITATRPVIEGWLATGYDLAADILPMITERTRRPRTDPIRTWDYFTPAIARHHARRTAQATRSGIAGEADAAGRDGAQTDALQKLTFMATWINSNRYVPPSAVSTAMRTALLAAGLVTEAALRARQIY
ncbi:hypothetical protein GALL_508960 [mine drainage metagenome]|uniref:Uncharacterized protein n=1 Tax=mine drainage metagenome TaxID=410659 RepID=A0A1J5PQG4_9ZZZZ